MAGSLRKLYTNKEILDAWEESGKEASLAADQLSLHRDVTISPQLLAYWLRNLTEVTKKNGDPYIGTTVLDRKIRKDMKLRRPSPKDYLSDVENVDVSKRLMIFTDDHSPYQHPDAIPFLIAVRDWIQPDRVVHGGDETDNHALSFHDSDPNLDAAGPELMRARVYLAELEKVFPQLEIMHSNHGSLVYRKAKKAGISVEAIKPYREILFPEGNGKGWSWHNNVRIELPDGSTLQVQHSASKDILSIAAHDRCNLIVGHNHSMFDIIQTRSNAIRYWAAHAGCMLDPTSAAFSYAAGTKGKSVIGCMVVIDSEPFQIAMKMDKHLRWTGELGGITKWLTLK